VAPTRDAATAAQALLFALTLSLSLGWLLRWDRGGDDKWGFRVKGRRVGFVAVLRF